MSKSTLTKERKLKIQDYLKNSKFGDIKNIVKNLVKDHDDDLDHETKAKNAINTFNKILGEDEINCSDEEMRLFIFGLLLDYKNTTPYVGTNYHLLFNTGCEKIDNNKKSQNEISVSDEDIEGPITVNKSEILRGMQTKGSLRNVVGLDIKKHKSQDSDSNSDDEVLDQDHGIGKEDVKDDRPRLIPGTRTATR